MYPMRPPHMPPDDYEDGERFYPNRFGPYIPPEGDEWEQIREGLEHPKHALNLKGDRMDTNQTEIPPVLVTIAKIGLVIFVGGLFIAFMEDIITLVQKFF